MRKISVFLFGVVLVGSVPAYAGPISITGVPADARLIATTTDNTNLGNEGDICAAFGQAAGCLSGATLRYKANSASADPATPQTESPMDASYDTTFTGTLGDWTGATISYNGAPNPYITCPNCFLIVKDGRQIPAQYLFSLNQVGSSLAWDGTSTITLSGFWQGVSGSISNIAIWSDEPNGTPDPSPTPDGGATLALMGGALVGLGILRRKLGR